MTSNQAEATHEQEIPLLRCRPGSCHVQDCPGDRAISTASPTSNATGGSSARPRPTQRQESSCASVGASKSYVFFVEIITKGAVDKGGRCPDGTITVARAGNDLALFWFGSIEANTIVAYGTLSKK